MTNPQPAQRESPSSSRGWPAAVIGGLVVWVAVRAVVALISLIVLWTRNGPSVTDRAGISSLDNGGDGFFAVLHHWDSNYFLAIASDGYFSSNAAPGMAGFFPGYPLAARGLSELITLGAPTNVSLVAALWVISSSSSVVAAIVLWRLVDIVQPAGVAPLAVLMFLAGPYSVFLYANYSEALFLAFAIAGWYCAVRDRWWLVGMWCALATATRINGCFLVAALIVMYVQHRRRDQLPLWAPRTAWILVAGAGVVAYFGYLAMRTGDLFAWNTAQAQGWGRGLHWPWEAFYQTAGRVLFASTLDRRLQFGLDIVVAAAILVAIVVWIRRKEWPPVTYAGLTLAALTTSFTFVSLARNSLTLFPLVILLASTVRSAKQGWVRIAIFGSWSALFLINTVLFTLGYWTD